ncbi:hypothetical protein FGO68_gene13707 [Halteria grandinella]|uniref:Clathrin adaptor alpha/beta/gamma-adaptin appendage Ig-like subdomain domain-containing protein n=1 Tax=Halteria grandinella TaxID=5974 RepID=A0A8J8SX68_HALGN|nr:hypothetical protein FGO68_gene13707 [Halteria grandinella]
MIELSESDPAAKEFVIEALDNMPNFSDSLQNNSILNRRIMKLKIEKGFTISKDEAMSKAKQELEHTESTMSAALQQVHSSPPAAQEAKHKQPSPQKKKAKEDPEAKYLQNVDNLLDMDMVPQQPAAAQQSPLDLISSISALQPPQGEDIMNNRFYLAHADRFSPQQTVKLGPQTFEAKNCSNGNQWKAMLPISMREGVIYSDDQIEVTCQIQIIKFLERIQISFTPKVLGPITDLQAKLSSSAFNDQLEMAVSPVKFRPDGIPEVIMMIMLKETMTLSPSLKFQYSQGSNQFQIEFRLPIFLNKFTEPVEMPSDAFSKTWDDITHNRPSSFQKIDAFIKNPAPPQVPVTEVLKKVANFFQNSMNLKVFPPEDPTNFWSVKAVGQVNFKPPTQVGFPSGPADIQKPIIAPVMIEAEFFKEDTSEFKLSFRSSDAKQVAAPLINFLKFYINPN